MKIKDRKKEIIYKEQCIVEEDDNTFLCKITDGGYINEYFIFGNSKKDAERFIDRIYNVLSSSFFYIIGSNGTYYKVHAIADCESNLGGLWCMVYKGIDSNPYDYEEMEYEEDYSDEFSIYLDECDCSNEEEIEKYIDNYIKEYID